MWKPSRSRYIGKWTGSVVCLLLMGAWLLGVYLPWFHSRAVTFHINLYQFALYNGLMTWKDVSEPCSGYSTGDVTTTAGDPWWDKAGLRWPRTGWRPGDYSAGYLPLWLPFLIVATPTAILWVRDRRPKHYPPGHCRFCGYDLTGNVSGTCPECGTACEKPTKQPDDPQNTPQKDR